MIHSRNKLALWLPSAFLVLTTASTFLPALRNDFVDLDDNFNIFYNPDYRGLGWPQLRWMFTTFLGGHYQPLSWVSFGFDYLLWGMDPFGYHLTNVLLHALNSLLFYFVCLRLLALTFPFYPADLSLRLAATLAALVFSIHPLRVESVAWITERRDVLSATFFFLTLLCYLKAVAESERRYFRWMAASVALYILSLLSKAAGMTLPVILLVLDVYPLKRLGGDPRSWRGPAVRAVWWEKLAFLLPAFAAAMTAAIAQGGAMESLARHGVGARLSQALFSLTYYVWKTALPFGLSPIYELPADFNPWAPPYVAAGAAVLASCFILVLLRKRWPAGLAVSIYYAAMVAPVSGIAQSGIQLVADRYSYLSCLGWALLVGGGMLYLSRRLYRNWKSLAVVWGFALTILIGLGSLAWRQTQVWRDSETLFQYALAVRPGARAHAGLGTVLWSQGQEAEAIRHYRQSLKFYPDYALVRVNLANALANQGNLDEAVEHYRHVLHLNLAFLEFRLMAYNNLGILLIRQGKLQEAAHCYREAIALAPAFQEAHSQLGLILLRTGKIDEAIEHHRKALELTPGSALLHFNLADALMSRGKLDEAIDHFRKALELDPGLEKARRGLTKATSRRNNVSPTERSIAFSEAGQTNNRDEAPPSARER